MDYRRYLARTSREVLPIFGGSRVSNAQRRLRVKDPVESGWWLFEITGRLAEAKARAEAPDLSRLPRRQGHWFQGWLFSDGRQVRRAFLVPASEPEPFSVCSARVWHDDTLVFDGQEFESDAEEAVRRA